MAYFANSSEGEVLDQQCAECVLGTAQCPTALIQALYNYDQCDNIGLMEVMNILVSKQGICQTRKQLMEEAE